MGNAYLRSRSYPDLLSLVIPLYNEEEMLPLLRERLVALMAQVSCPVELILVDDGSRDDTVCGLLEWARTDRRVVVLALARNFGHQAAATAGLDAAVGEAIVLMDADLQDPPELIHKMVAQYQSGYDVVYAQRKARIGESFFKRGTAWMFYRIMQLMVHDRLPRDTGDYRLISREVLDVMKSMRETHRFLRGMVAWAGFPQTAIQFVRPPRAAGETKYPLSKMLRFAWTAITSFSPAPLRMTFGLGTLIGFVGLALAVYALLAVILGWPIERGWTSLMLTLCMIGSAILLCLGVMGEYVAKIYEESKGRPLYLVHERISVRRDASVEQSSHIAAGR
jgi:dolichol-phosphate mannosyltransferase